MPDEPTAADDAGLQLTVRVTGRGVVAVVLGVLLVVGGVWWHYAGMLALGTGLLVLAVAALASVLLPAPVVPTRRITPLRVVRNDACRATLRVRSAGRRFAVDLDADERIGERRVPVTVPRLRPGGVVEVTYPIPTTRRGVVPVGPLRLRRVGVAGLAVAEGVVGTTLAVHVLPRVLPVVGLPSGVRRGHVGADERVERGGTDLQSLREYVAGDDLRRVHWATSARTGSLMVREDVDPARPFLTVLLDDRAGRYEGDGFEDAVEVVASLVDTAVEAGHPVRLFTVSGRVDVDVPAATPGTVAVGTDTLARELADVRAVDDDSAAPLALRDPDVVVVATGAGGLIEPLIAEAARASLGVVLAVDPRHAGVEARGSVLVLRGPRAEELLGSWDAAVAR